MEPVFFIALFVLLAVGLAVYGWYAAEQRKKALRAWAADNGLSYADEKFYGLDEEYPEFEYFRRGDNRYGYNVMEGARRGRAIRAFDYHYETHSTDSKGRRQTHHHRFSAVIVESPVPLKPLFIRPEGFLDKITEFFGWDDIDFESAEFSRKFYVKSPDKKWAYDVLHPRAMEFLLSMPQFTMSFGPGRAVAHRGSTFAPREFAQAADALCGLLDLLPEYLVKQQREIIK